MPDDAKRTKIAILGGGMAGITAAYELSRTPELRARYEVTVYQQGWRLGGKGASGRNQDHYDRIEEHGLHVWLGWYDNAFRLMRECYEALDRRPGEPLATWRDAFKPSSTVGLEDFHNGEWRHFVHIFPENEELPGDPDIDDDADVMWRYLGRSLELLRLLLFRLMESLNPEDPRPRIELYPANQDAPLVLPNPERTMLPISWLSMGGGARTALAMVRSPLAGVGALPLLTALELAETAVSILSRWLADRRTPLLDLLASVVDRLAGEVRRALGTNDTARRLWQVIELVMANLRGVFADDLLFGNRALDTIDHLDYREWLRANGASELALDSAVLKGIYDLAFAYEDGDPDTPRVAAGTALRLTLSLFLGYKGAIFWRMQAGMGDTVFVPFYEVLKERGVRFEFFHRVEKLKLAEDGTSIASVDVTRQATLNDGIEAYDPLIAVKGLPCWPSAPRYDQLLEGEQIRAFHEKNETLESFWTTWKREDPTSKLTLEHGKDFDHVIFAISLGSVPWLCADLVAANVKWKDMVERVRTVRTQAFQVWLTHDLRDTGWSASEHSPIVAGYAEPFDTWADMSHLLKREGWDVPDPQDSHGQPLPELPSSKRPKSVMYFCNVMPDDRDIPPPADDRKLPPPEDRAAADRALDAQARVRESAVRFLRGPVGQFWPLEAERYPDRFKWENLADPEEAALSARFDRQYYRANVDPSERYVLTLPDSNRFRIKPNETGFANLSIAGDWTDCEINAGCIEAAVVSGIMAAAGITNVSERERRSGFLAP